MTSRAHPPCLTSNHSTLFKSFPRMNHSSLLKRDSDVDNVLEEAIRLYGSRGTFGAYTISTLLLLMSFKDYYLRYDDRNNEYVTFYMKNLQKSLTCV